MSEEVRQWLIGIAAASVIAGLTELLAPGGSHDRIVRLAAGLFMIITVAAPLISVARNASFDSVPEVVSELTVGTSMDSLFPVRFALESAIRATAQRYGIEVTAVEISLTENEDGCILVEEAVVRIRARSSDDVRRLSKALQTDPGISATVIKEENG